MNTAEISREVVQLVNNRPANKDQWFDQFWRAMEIAKFSTKGARLVMEELAGCVMSVWGLTLETSDADYAEMKRIKQWALDTAAQWA